MATTTKGKSTSPAVRQDSGLAPAPASSNAIQQFTAPNAIEQMTRGEIDVQIHTAKSYPRDLTRFLANSKMMATLNDETAGSCMYSVPRGGKQITGPSVRLAEIMVANYQNLRVSGSIIDDDGLYVTAMGVAGDLENNVAYQVQVKVKVTDRSGRRYSDDMVQTAMQSAIAKATRNATFKVIPRAFVDQVYDACIAKLNPANQQQLQTKLDNGVAYFAKMGITLPQIEEALGRIRADMTSDDLFTMAGWKTALASNDTTLDQLFRPSVASAPKIAEAEVEEVDPADVDAVGGGMFDGE